VSEELDDLRQRVERLEEQLGTLEYRLTLDEMNLEIMTVSRRAARSSTGAGSEPAGDVGQDAELSRDPHFGRIESMLRSVLLHQGSHTADLRSAVRHLQILVERKIK
jgi:hypothetical protein